MFALVGERIQRIVSTSASPTTIDNVVFRLYYAITSLAMFICAVLSTSVEHFGKPIECISSSVPNAIPEHALTTFCWIQGTFTLQPDLDSYSAHPGVFKYIPDDEGIPRTHHLYYQWVCLVLLAQSISFYIPRYFWRLAEGGLTRKLMSGEVPALSRYLMSHQSCHGFLALSYHLCEMLNVVILVSNFILTDMLLNGKFRDLGLFVIRGGDLSHIFPRMAKCTFQMFGPTAEVERHDSMCLLAQNVFNEKIFLALWFWYLFLAAASLLSVVYSLTMFMCVAARRVRISFVCAAMTARDARPHREKRVGTVINSFDYGDFFVLRLLSKNIRPQTLPQLLTACYATMKQNITDPISRVNIRMRHEIYRQDTRDDTRLLLN